MTQTTSEWRCPQFGDIIENGWASEDNPTRVGLFVREGRRTGRMNAGRYYEVTDGKGKFWELPLTSDHKITVRPPPTGEEFLEFKEALSDLRSLRQEHADLNGGGPDWSKRNEAAWARVDELFADEDEAAYDSHIESFYG